MTPLEELWEKVAQPGDDGHKYITYKGEQDLIFLYANGFVDFRKYTAAAWVEAFTESKQKNGSYRVTREQWLAKEKYRLNEPVGEPFDPGRLKEKEITEAEFAAVLKHFICPSTWIPEANIPNMLEYYRKNKKLANGKIRIDPSIKKEFKDVLEKLPSPLRVLQLDVARVRGKRKTTGGKSAYVAGADAQKVAAERLRQLSQTRPAPKTETAKKEGIPLKELKKRPTPGRV